MRLAGRNPTMKSAPKVKAPRSARQTTWEMFKAILWALAIALLIRQFVFQAFRIPTGSMRNTLLEGDFLFVNKFLYGARTPERIRVFRWTLVKGLPVLELPALRQPRQGDIIVFEYPLDRNTDYIKRCVAVAGDRVELRDGVLRVNGEIYESDLDNPRGDNSCVSDWRHTAVCPLPHTLHDANLQRSHPLKQNFGLADGLATLRGRETDVFVAVAEAAVRAGVLDGAACAPHLTALRGSLPPAAVYQPENAVIDIARAAGAPYVVPDHFIFMMGDNRDNSEDSRFWGPVSLDLLKGKAEILYFSWDKDNQKPRIGRMFSLIK
jgi:signal peptidase I